MSAASPPGSSCCGLTKESTLTEASNVQNVSTTSSGSFRVEMCCLGWGIGELGGFAERNTKTTQIEAADVTKAKVLRNMVPNEYSDFCSVMYLVTSSYRTMCDEKKKKTFK